MFIVLKEAIKYCINDDFKLALKWEKLQYIIESLSMPEAYGDWDTDKGLDIDGHLRKWKKVLVEMLIMALLQFLSNLCHLIPFYVTGITLRLLEF